MSWLDAFITPKEGDKKVEETTKPVYTPPDPKPFVPNMNTANLGVGIAASVVHTGVGQTISSNGTFDSTIFEELSKAMDFANLPGPDYYEFRNAIQAQKDLPIPDNQKYAMVYSTLQASEKSFNKEKLTTSIQHYLEILDTKKKEFEEGKAANFNVTVTSKQKEVEKNDTLIQQKMEQISALNKDIQDLQLQNQELQKGVEAATVKINTVALNFDYTWLFLVNQIKDDLKKIESYITK